MQLKPIEPEENKESQVDKTQNNEDTMSNNAYFDPNREFDVIGDGLFDSPQ